jgi:hypothetical protein
MKIIKTIIITGVFLLASCNQPYYQNTQRCVIKGNISYNGGELIYHMPGQRFYDATIPEYWFCTEDQARRAGFRRAKV